MPRNQRRGISHAPRIVASACLILAPGFVAPSRASNPGAGLQFTEVTEEAGIALPDVTTESVAWGDVDGDGDPDLFLAVDGPDRLFRNDGGGVFTDISGAVGLTGSGQSVGTAFGDLDNDGDLDLYVLNGGEGPDALYRNDGPAEPGGDPRFVEVAANAGITDESSLRGMGFLDYDADGLLDIYVNAAGPDLLYRNLGGWSFENVAPELGVDAPGNGVGFVGTDLDGNGWIDIFTGNRSGEPNQLSLNDHGLFTDVTQEAGIDQVGLGMGVLSFDFDNDLDFDLYWTSWPGEDPDGPQPNALYRNRGDATFAEVAAESGTEDPLGWGVSCNAADLNLDGWMDFLVTNGASVESTPNVLFLNLHDGTFDDVTFLLGGADFDGRGVAFADYDGDGDLDLALTGGVDAPNQLWRNDTDNPNRRLTLELTGTTSNRSAVGTRVEVTTDLATTVQEVSGGAGRGSHNDLPLTFGLGAATEVREVRVLWPSGRRQTLTDLPPDQLHRVVEPPVLRLGGACPGAVTLELSGLTAGGDVVLLSADAEGPDVVPTGPCAGTPLDLASPIPRARIAADNHGRLELTAELPAGACPTFLQAVDLERCVTSDLGFLP